MGVEVLQWLILDFPEGSTNFTTEFSMLFRFLDVHQIIWMPVEYGYIHLKPLADYTNFSCIEVANICRKPILNTTFFN